MFIKSLDIENFGNISKKHFDFSSGENSFFEENGFGKSTISAFIKALFYGLEERGRRTLPIIERERYFPWNKNRFGGSLIFNFHDKDYKVTRFFDEKKLKNDTFEIIDAVTKKSVEHFFSAELFPTEKISSENLGLKIFGINKESFERSCFVTLDDLKAPALNDDIAGKLNNIISAEDDIGNFEKASKAIDEEIKNNDGRGNSSKKTIINSKIADLNEKIKDAESVENAIPQLENLIEKEKLNKKNILEKIAAVENEKNNVVLYEQKKMYENLHLAVEQENNEIEKLSNFFLNNLPTEETKKIISSIKNANAELQSAKIYQEKNPVTKADRDSFLDLQKFFYPCAPSIEELDNCQRLINQKKSIEQNLSELKIAQMQAVSNQEKVVLENRAQFEKLKSKFADFEKKLLSQKKRRVIFGALSVFMILILAFSFIFSVNKIVSFVFIGLSCVSAACFFVSFKKIKFLEKNEFDNLKSKCKNDEEKLSSIKNNFSGINEQNIELEKINTELKNFLAVYKEKCAIFDNDEVLILVRKNLVTYQNLVKLIPQFDEAQKKEKSCTEFLTKTFADFKTSKALSFDAQLDELQKNLLNYENKIIDLKNKKSELLRFEQNYDIEKIQTAKKSEKNLEEIQTELDFLQKELHQISVNIKSYEDSLDQNFAVVDRKAEFENELIQLKSENLKVREKVELLEKTKVLLKKAKETLSEKYMSKMESSFFKYLNLMLVPQMLNKNSSNNSDEKDKNLSTAENLSKQISISSDLKISVNGEGSDYKIDYLSSGYKDLVNFCTRLALVDAMFENEKPLIVLDDPFINLDEEKIQSGLEILKSVSKEKQIIYFTCHQSRGLKN